MAQAPVAPDPAFGTTPSTPYHGTTGHAPGAGPSAERAHREAVDGTAAARQARIIALLSDAGPVGMTADELARRNVAPHRSAVSAHTSSLHKEGRIACLRDRRDGAGIYVLPQYVQGRPTRAFAGRTDDPNMKRPTSLRDATDRLAEAVSEIERLRRVLEANGVADDGTRFAPDPTASTAIHAATESYAVPDESVAQQGHDLATALAEVDRLREQNGWQAEEIERLVTERDQAEAAFKSKSARPRLTPEEETLVDNIQNGLPGLKDKGVVSLRWVSAKMLIDAVRRLDADPQQ